MTAFLLQQSERSQLTQFLTRDTSDPVVLVTALAMAFFLGAAHALTPGHGKTIVAAYLAGSRGRIADAFYLGGVVTLTHTGMVFLLGFAALYASRQVPLDRVFPWLSLLSGALVAMIGLWLLYQRTRGHTHPHHHHHSHSHGNDHSHSHSEAARGSLLSLGISGGMVPCPEALVVLMLAISIRKIAFGMAMLAFFSLGLAAVLIAIGCAMVLAGPAVKWATGGSVLIRKLPIVSALVVAAAGLAMVVQAVKAL